jgi:hypothetical protein
MSIDLTIFDIMLALKLIDFILDIDSVRELKTRKIFNLLITHLVSILF